MTSAPALPAPRFFDPSSAPALRWGVLAPGWIASNFAHAIHTHSNQRIVAVGSRTASRAQEFAAKFGIERSYDAYDGVLADPDVDVVYIASPHSQHREHALSAIAAGKHVLVEKPFTRNAAEAREVVAAAHAAGVFVMEAMWSRYLPHTDVLRQLLDDGALGEVRHVRADFGSRADVDPGHRLLDPALAGGVTLDLGVYPLAFASFVARHSGLGRLPGAVVESSSSAESRHGLYVAGELAETGVDATVSVQAVVGPMHASLFSTLLAETPQTALVAGTAGRVETGPQFYAPTSLTVHRGGTVATWDDNRVRGLEGLSFQAAALARYITDGLVESPLHPLTETIAVLEAADAIRGALGVRYPGE